MSKTQVPILLHCYSTYISAGELLSMIKKCLDYVNAMLQKSSKTVLEREAVLSGFTFVMKELINNHYQEIKEEKEKLNAIFDEMKKDDSLSTVVTQLQNNFYNKVSKLIFFKNHNSFFFIVYFYQYFSF